MRLFRHKRAKPGFRRRVQLIALVQASNTLPIMMFALVSGALADIFDRRQIMIAAITFMGVMSAGLALVAWFGAITPWILLAFTFLIGLGQALYNPPWQASMGDLVPRDLPHFGPQVRGCRIVHGGIVCEFGCGFENCSERG